MCKSNLLIALAVGAALAAPAVRADAGDTAVGGVVFADATHVSATSAGNDVDSNKTGTNAGNGVDVKRAYLIVNHQFDDIWSANLTTDFNFASYKDSCTVSSGAAGETCAVTTTTPETQLFVKKAYLQGKFDDMLVLHVGSYDMPWIPYAEGVYGYRFIENTLIDRSQANGIGSFGNSADWGVNVNGANAMLNYSASLVNGGGYKNPTRTKAMDFEGRVGFTPFDGLIVGVGYYNGSLGQDTNANQLNAEGHPKLGLTQNQANREDALVAWKANGLTVGLEYFTAKNFGSSLIFSKATDSEDGYSLYGSYDIPGTDYGFYARYDNVRPKRDTESGLKDTYFNGGFAWRANKKLTWAFGFKSDQLKDDSATTPVDLKTQEIGVWLQAKY